MQTNLWTISYQFWNITFCSDKENMKAEDDYEVFDFEDINTAWNTLLEKKQNVWVWTPDMDSATKYVMDRHIFVEAAGGVIINNKKESLLIFRNEHWDLPKGMIEKGETPEKGAVREVEEETGLSAPVVEDLLLTSYHIYNLYGGWHIKKTYWYRMKYESNEELIPQREEGITRCEWCTPELRNKYLNNSYAMMKMINNLLV